MEAKKSYPANLLKALQLNETLGTDIDYENLTEDQLDGVDYLFETLTDRERIVLTHYYREGMTRKAIVEKYDGITEKIVRRVINDALKKIRVREWLQYAANGYEANKKRLEEQSRTEEARYCRARGIADPAHFYYQGIEKLNYSPLRMRHALERSGIHTIRDLLFYICVPSSRYVRDFGEVSMRFVRGIFEKEDLLPKNFKMDIAPNAPRLDIEANVFRRLNEYAQSAAPLTA